MNLVTEAIGWRWIRFGRGYRRHLATARLCPEIAREHNREAFWHLAWGVAWVATLLPAWALILVMSVFDWAWQRLNDALPAIVDLRERATADAHKIMTWSEIADRVDGEAA